MRFCCLGLNVDDPGGKFNNKGPQLKGSFFYTSILEKKIKDPFWKEELIGEYEELRRNCDEEIIALMAIVLLFYKRMNIAQGCTQEQRSMEIAV